MNDLLVLLALLGAVGGLAAGVLGFGGGVVMFPLLLYVPKVFGVPPLDAKTVAALVVTQVFFSTLVGGWAHLRSHRVHRGLALTAGAFSAVGALVGGIASKWVPEFFLIVLFGIVTLLVAALMFSPAPSEAQENTAVDCIEFPQIVLSVLSFFAGLVVGFLGAGNFIFVPLLIYILKVPTRIAIGSSLFIAMINTSTGFLGKLVTGQIPYLMALVVVGGGAAGALVGERLHRRLPTRVLRAVYAAMVALIAVQVWLDIMRP